MLPPHTELVCYADDTLILSGRRDKEEACKNASVAAAMVSRISTLGLTLAAQKTEAVIFCPSGVTEEPVRFMMGPRWERASVKYLGR